MREVTTREQFFKQLKKNLRFKYGHAEMHSIISDYEEIFEIELARGREEQDICHTLGNPAVIVRNLDQEMNSGNKKVKTGLLSILFRNKYWLIVIAAALILMYTISNSYRISRYSPVIIECVILIPVIAAFIGLQIKKEVHGRTEHGEPLSPVKFAASHLICIAIMLLVFGMSVYLYLMLFRQLPFLGLKQENIGIFVSRVLMVSIFCLGGLILYGVCQMRKNVMPYFTLVTHGIGAIMVIAYNLHVLLRLDVISEYPQQIRIMGFLYLESIVLTALVGCYIQKKGMR